MRIAVPTETDPAETRVAATPETVKKLIALGFSVVVQSGAGTKAGMPDGDFVVGKRTIHRPYQSLICTLYALCMSCSRHTLSFRRVKQ